MLTACLPFVRNLQAAVRPFVAVLLLTATFPATAAQPKAALPPTPAQTGRMLRSDPAAPALGAGRVLLAEGTGWRSYFGGFTSRSRIIQTCIVVMSLALFILMRKLAEPSPRRGKERRGEGEKVGLARTGPHATAS